MLLSSCSGEKDKDADKGTNSGNNTQSTSSPAAASESEPDLTEMLKDIEYTIPDTWTLADDDVFKKGNFLIYNIVAPDEKDLPGTTATLKISVSTGDRDASVVADDSRKILLEPLSDGRRIFQNPKLISEGVYEQNGLTGYEYKFTASADGLEFTGYHLYVNKDDRVYMFEFQIGDKTISDFEDEYETFCKSIM